MQNKWKINIFQTKYKSIIERCSLNWFQNENYNSHENGLFIFFRNMKIETIQNNCVVNHCLCLIQRNLNACIQTKYCFFFLSLYNQNTSNDRTNYKNWLKNTENKNNFCSIVLSCCEKQKLLVISDMNHVYSFKRRKKKVNLNMGSH